MHIEEILPRCFIKRDGLQVLLRQIDSKGSADIIYSYFTHVAAHAQ